ncbi:MAG: lipocalin family protein [Deltaproteobacteria bacterium]|nr:lipocalin family protein [Deltaproteobacteria bacterium]
MKHLCSALLIAGCATSPAAPTAQPRPARAPSPVAAIAPVDPTLGPPPTGDTVANVDVGRYTGTWFEIARVASGFERACTGTTATYAPIDATTVSVHNHCTLGALDGAPIEITGSARVVDPSNARLEVDFGFARAPYWIVDLGVADPAAPYPWAVVSNPARTSLWILSREPHMSAGRYDALVARLTARGYHPERLERTLQP